MGFRDRDYYREERAEPIHGGTGWTMTTWLIVVTVSCFVLNMMSGNDWLVRHAAATPRSLQPQYWWQLVTYGFMHDSSNVFHIFWNMYALWLFGRAVEDLYGKWELLRIYLLSMLLGGIAWSARVEYGTGGGGLLMGASGATTAVTILFCIHYPHSVILYMGFLPMPAWLLGTITIAGDLIGSMSGVGRTAFDVHLVGAAFAGAYWRFGWHLGRWLPSSSRSRSWFRRQPKLRVHHPSNDVPDDPQGDVSDLAEEGDRLLAKVNQVGIDGLTPRERQLLEEYSRQIRNKRR